MIFLFYSNSSKFASWRVYWEKSGKVIKNLSTNTFILYLLYATVKYLIESSWMKSFCNFFFFNFLVFNFFLWLRFFYTLYILQVKDKRLTHLRQIFLTANLLALLGKFNHIKILVEKNNCFLVERYKES